MFPGIDLNNLIQYFPLAIGALIVNAVGKVTDLIMVKPGGTGGKITEGLPETVPSTEAILSLELKISNVPSKYCPEGASHTV